MIPWLLLTILLTNLALCTLYPYNVMFLLQGIFYISSAIGAIAARLHLRVPVFHLSYFFVISNVASIVSFWSFLFKVQKAMWTKVE